MPTVLVVGRPHSPDPTDLAPLIVTLAARGNRVIVLGTEEHRDVAARAEVGFSLLPPLPEKSPRSQGSKIGELRELFRSLLIDPLAAHWETVERVVERERPDVVLADALCFAACMLAEYPPRDDRPAVVVLGTIPPPHAQTHAAPYGLGMQPDESAVNRVRNWVLHQFMRRVILRPVLPELHSLFYELTGRVMSRDSYEAASKAELWVQCEPDRFEYPHTAADNLRLVGALAAAPAVELPRWWDEAHQRPIVHARVTLDVPLKRFVVPLVEALDGSGQNLVITGTTTRAVVTALGRELPTGTYVAEGLPASRVISHTGVAVMKGYLVHTQHALQQGLPVVTYGSGAEERETGARLEWNDCGVHLSTDEPTSEQLRDAVHRVLSAPGYRQAAARIAVQAANTDAEASIADLIEALVPVTR